MGVESLAEHGWESGRSRVRHDPAPVPAGVRRSTMAPGLDDDGDAVRYEVVREPFGGVRTRRAVWEANRPDDTGAEVVGVLEIAQRLGVSRAVVSRWVDRHWPMTGHDEVTPHVLGTVSGQLAFRWSDVERWARWSGRLPADWDE